MGGMLAVRFTLMYPQSVERLALEDPIGLEDYRTLVPYIGLQQEYEAELGQTYQKMLDYQKTYYPGAWKPEYERWVDMLAGLNQGPGHELVAWNSALIYDMIFSQPIVYELPLLKMDTVLMIGDADTTAIGSDIAPAEVKAKLGHYAVLGKDAAQRIPHARLIEFPGMGHAPQMEDPESFNRTLIDSLSLLHH